MGAATDGQEIVRLSKEHAELKPVADAVQGLARARAEMADLEAMTADPEMAAMAQDLPTMTQPMAMLAAGRATPASRAASGVASRTAGQSNSGQSTFTRTHSKGLRSRPPLRLTMQLT